MSSLWTPGGEHPIGKEEPAQPPGARQESPLSSVAQDEFDDEEVELSEEQIAQMRELEERLAATPASVVVANHAYGLFELAALHLGRRPPNFEEAQVAIDAMGALVEGMGSRLGDHTKQLQEGLTQLRLAFVQVKNAGAGEPD